ncbi:MAG: SprT-like family protein [Planctomycetia bacterium]|nr:SprT-like family protein [Planctomycetia bacterium]
MTADIQQFIETHALPADVVTARTREIYDALLRRSRCLGCDNSNGGNFSRLDAADLRLMFELYDALVFDGRIQSLLGGTPLSFRLSKRMTRVAGQASRRVVRNRQRKPVRTEYEIAVSTTLLFQTFEEDHRPVVMSGIECRDRLEALQRVFEHELVHVVEMLLWVESRCTAARFQSIARRFFAHTDHRHQLITPYEMAVTKFGIRPGDRVVFAYEGRRREGFVNRITRRATVLVKDGRGRRYTDGGRYAAFYVPMEKLTRVERPEK